MLYCVIAKDVPESLNLRKQARPEHLKRLEILKSEGRLFLAGPFPDTDNKGFTGSLIIAEFDNLETAKNWAEDDPFFHAGVYASVTVKPFKKVLP